MDTVQQPVTVFPSASIGGFSERFRLRALGQTVFGFILLGSALLLGYYTGEAWLGDRMKWAGHSFPGSGDEAAQKVYAFVMVILYMEFYLITMGLGYLGAGWATRQQKPWAGTLNRLLGWTSAYWGLQGLAMMFLGNWVFFDYVITFRTPVLTAIGLLFLGVAVTTIGVPLLLARSGPGADKMSTEAVPPESCNAGIPLELWWLAGWLVAQAGTVCLGWLVRPPQIIAFGQILTPTPTLLLGVACPFVLGWCAWALLTKRRAGWWLALVLLLVIGCSRCFDLLSVETKQLPPLFPLPEKYWDFRPSNYFPTTVEYFISARLPKIFLGEFGLLATGLSLLPVLVVCLRAKKHFIQSSTD